MSEWQPISTAPRDGRLLLLFVPDHHAGPAEICIVQWCEHGWLATTYYIPEEAPTHWMSLPYPPQEAA